ncbi:F-box protein interaction domain protein [Medicago truncatula]|uniref:F-box protein interaction domain protein n=2 Tax=Medicago truncatula TaxID=3880 RepID=G7K868_MEDTR|nr:F-box protein interaction domain protein [Medicago truncatula]
MKRTRESIASSTTRHRSKPAKELGSFADLSSLIITNILLQLPIKDVSICKCVCKTWNALISEPYFATLYSQHASLGFLLRTRNLRLVSRTLHLLEYQPKKFRRAFDIDVVNFNPKFKLPLRNANDTYQPTPYKPEDDKFSVVNSCNGLLCLSEPYTVNHLVVCNPIIGEFIRLPEAIGIANTRKPICAALGFQPKTNEYKVIRMWKRCDGWCYKSDVMVVEMHTLGTATWRNVEVDPMFSFTRLGSPTCVNGALHWINYDDKNKTRSILCFNFESEKFQSFPSPPHPHHKRLSITMVELKGFLYICESTVNSCVVWLMKKYGIGESWTRVFCSDNFNGIPLCFGLCRPVKHFENGGGALLIQNSYSCDSFIYYEPETRVFKVYSVDGAVSPWFELFPHSPGLISLKDVVKGGNIEVQNVYSRCAKVRVPEENESLSKIRRI